VGGAESPNSVVAEIQEFNRRGKPWQVQIKYARMSTDTFAFLRGTDHLLARAWASVKPPHVGPEILLCGDLHLENFGAYRSSQGELLFDINDFDEALVAPCSLDLVRCTASIVLAAVQWGLSAVDTNGMALGFLDRYRTAVAEAVTSGVVGDVVLGGGHGPIWELLDSTALGSQAALLNHYTEKHKSGERRIIRVSEKRFDIRPERANVVREAVERHGQSTAMPNAFRVLDVTGRIAGIGSVGLRRYCVLTEGQGSPDTHWLLDVKEERAPALLPIAGKGYVDIPDNEAQRVVYAQRQLQSKPTAGLDVLQIAKSSYRIRELIPEENRSNLDRLQKNHPKLREAVGMAGQLAGWSHVRGCRVAGEDRSPALTRWASGPALDAVLAASMRYADQTEHDYQEFRAAYGAGRLAH
jgi:uncharacterized protein (DUF2252 family)